MKDAFANPYNYAEREIATIIAEGDAEGIHPVEAELFKQKTQLANPECALQSKPAKRPRTTSASEWTTSRAHSGISMAFGGKTAIARFPHLSRLVCQRDGSLRTATACWSRCAASAGWNEATESKYPGTYNERRDNLKKP